MHLKEELNSLNELIKKRNISYSEFNDIIGNYYVLDYEELEDDYYLIKVMTKGSNQNSENYYTDYVKIMR